MKLSVKLREMNLVLVLSLELALFLTHFFSLPFHSFDIHGACSACAFMTKWKYTYLYARKFN